ncbi:glycosyltransferase family 4 protein [Arthrobacter sp. TB 26]|uniref:glycosyltransferase family 4 protein n=1 Tax=Arthrobacter sp. TB 26 TaxID=494420 RepID=UPI0004124FFF|nr:glycosyltransferase family 4 protein [Arthrobacter sp. TB 26]
MVQLLKALRMMIRIVGQHVADDPVLLLVQISRRVPSAVLPAARLVGYLAPRDSLGLPILLAGLVRGDDADIIRRLQFDSAKSIKGKQASRLADIALAARQPELADRFIAAAGTAIGLNAVRARRFWYDGAVSAAAAVLNGPDAASLRLRQRLTSETAVLRNFAPALARRDFAPLPGRVLHLLTNSLPHTNSGYAQRSHSALLAQREAGWDVLAVTRIAYPVLVGKIFAKSNDIIDGITYRRLLPEILGSTAESRLQQQAEELLQAAIEFRPSILHTTSDFTNGLVVRAVAGALGIPWVYEVRGQLADTWASTRGPEARNSERYHLFQQRETEVMRDADLIVTLGDSMKANIIARGVQEAKIILAPNAVGEAFLDAPVDVATARRALGMPETGKYFGTVSSLVPYEGIDDLIAVFDMLAPSIPELHLLIVGDGVSLPGLKEHARLSTFGDRITFTGRVSRAKARLYHQALDVFVVPRLDLEVTRSVTPLKPVEALACARPVLASRLPALQEIVNDGANGLLAAAGDRLDFATKLERLFSSGELRDRLGRAGRQGVLDHRTWQANADTLNVAYQQLMEAPR